MALTAEQKTEIINIVNGADFMQPPEVVEGDTLWYPGDIDMIKAGTSLKLKYNSCFDPELVITKELRL